MADLSKLKAAAFCSNSFLYRNYKWVIEQEEAKKKRETYIPPEDNDRKIGEGNVLFF